MPKKTAGARGGASRNKPKTQKNIQLVRPVSVEKDVQEEDKSSEEESTVSAPSTAAATTATASKTRSKSEMAAAKSGVETLAAPEEKEEAVADTIAAGKGSASARLAARRQQAQKQQAQRTASLITSEHYAYVKRDLVYIAILAAIFFTTLIVLHFVPAIGG